MRQGARTHHLQALVIVIVQHGQRVAVFLQNRQNALRFAGGQAFVVDQPGRQGNCLLELDQLFLLRLKPLLIKAVAPYEMIFQHTVGPDAKLRTLFRLYAVTDRDDHIEVIVRRIVAFAIDGSYPEIPDN